MARSTLKFDRLQLIFKHAFKTLFQKMNNSSKCDSILSSIVKVEHHPQTQSRKQGTRFKSGYTWIENGAPTESRGNKRFGRGHHQPERRAGGYQRPMYEQQQRTGGYQRSMYEQSDRRYVEDNSYHRHGRSQEPYTNRYDDYNEREYQRHKRNNNSHLAEHYRHKSRR